MNYIKNISRFIKIYLCFTLLSKLTSRNTSGKISALKLIYQSMSVPINYHLKCGCHVQLEHLKMFLSNRVIKFTKLWFYSMNIVT